MDTANAVQKFFSSNQNNPDLLKASTKILIKLIENAQKPDEKYRMVRLGNPKIQQAVVEQHGALDLMFRAGFSKLEVDGETVLVYQNPTAAKAAIAQSIVEAMKAGLQVMQPNKAPTTSGKTTSNNVTSPNNNNSNNNNNTFLSEEERKKRQEKARAKRKADKEAKLRAMRQWNEDKEHRDEVKERNKALKELSIKDEENASSKRHRKENEEAAPATLEEYRAMHRQRVEAEAAKQQSVQESTNEDVEEEDDDEAMDIMPPTMDEETSLPAVGPGMDVEISPQDQKPAAKAQPMETEDDEPDTAPAVPWDDETTEFPTCASAEGIRESSIYQNEYSSDTGSSPPCLRKLLRELDGMKQQLPTDARCPIWVRFDEETPQFLRAVIGAALPGPSPYAGGLFCFDIFVPNDYPNVSPKVTLLTTGGGSVRFGPNLYANGKVCLSLLGTWPGPKWEPKVSNITQVLMSIQGLILGVAHPYYLEPGHGGWEGSVKDGDFSSTGHTLAGATVTESIGLPMQVVHYENILVQGTLKYALLEMVEVATKDVKSLRYLSSFRHGIQIHLSKNRDLILNEMNSWEADASRLTNQKQDDMDMPLGMGGMQQQPSPSSIAKLCSRLRSKLLALPKPGSIPAAEPAPVSASAMSVEASDDEKKPAPTARTDKPKKQIEDPVAHVRSLIEEAAVGGDYVKAGNLQSALETEQKAISELEESIKEAACEGNYIRAGKLQTQLKARMAAVEDIPKELQRQSTAMGDLMRKKNPPIAAPVAGSSFFGDENDSSDEDEMDEEDVDDMEEDTPPGPFPGGPAGGGGFPGMSMHNMPKGWHPPAGSHTRIADRNHQWGTGRTLKSEAKASSNTYGEKASPDDLDKKPAARSSVATICHLRIRLPNSTVLVEEFDAEETIAVIYKRLDPHLEGEMASESTSNSNIAPVATQGQVMTNMGLATVKAPAFSRPLSQKGYTLIMSHPKREFSLEMHGTKTLREMNLTSASLTVMKSVERGVVKRGDLESRLVGAQGDAMDVDGLGYEALLELTQRVGASETEWGAEKETKFSENSILIAPKEYCASLKDGSDSSSQCPICLGEFDSSDETRCLRQLRACRHSDRTFHESCLRTWLQTKTSCPICKTCVFDG